MWKRSCRMVGSGSSPRDRILVSVLAGMTARHHNKGCAQGCGSNCLAGSGHHSLGRPRSPLRVHVTPSVGSNRDLSASSFGVGQRPMNNCLHFDERPERAGKRCKREVAVGKLVIPSGDAAKMLDAIKEAFDQIASAVQGTTVAALRPAIRARWDDDLRPGSPNSLHEGVGIVALVRNDRLCAQMFDQFVRTGDIGNLSFGDDQPQRAASCIHGHMQFRTQPGARSAQRLRTTFLMPRPNAGALSQWSNR